MWDALAVEYSTCLNANRTLFQRRTRQWLNGPEDYARCSAQVRAGFDRRRAQLTTEIYACRSLDDVVSEVACERAAIERFRPPPPVWVSCPPTVMFISP
jgi:hypothetical protein